MGSEMCIRDSLYELTPEQPYTSQDLSYNNDACRASQEQKDPAARPRIAGQPLDLSQYGTIYLGYPIWWGQAPKIISTFLESHDFSGKTIIPFCTSGSSGIGSSAENLRALADGANWLDGRRFGGGNSEAEVRTWLDTIELPGSGLETAPEIRIEDDLVTVTHVPENATLILAFYKQGVLCNAGQKTGGGTIAASISDKAKGADAMKAYLWDMYTIKPLCGMVQMETKEEEPMRVRVASDEYEIIYALNDSQAAKDFYAQLPLTLEVENYSTNEKIFYPPKELDVSDAPAADAEKGTLAYFAPWKDVVMFYDHFGAGSGLYALGEAVSGRDGIEKLTGTITVSVWQADGI